MDALRNSIKNNLPIIFLIALSSSLLFPGLGNQALSIDEGSDTFIAATILKYGHPRHSDGINHTMDFADVYDGVFVYRTWVPYYLQAFSMKLFGQTAFAARLPFAITGVLSVALLYLLTLKLAANKRIAFLASLFLACSVPALILFRNARYLSLPILFTILLLYFYLDLYKDKKWNPLPLFFTAFLYFHSMYVVFASTSLGILTHLIIYRRDVVPANFKKALWMLGALALALVPWVFVVQPVFSQVYKTLGDSSPLIDLSNWGYLKRLPGFLFQLNNYIFPVILLPLAIFGWRKFEKKWFLLIVLCPASNILVALLHPIPSQFYIAAAFPLLYILLAMMLENALPAKPGLKYSLAAVLIVTNLLHVGPLTLLRPIIESAGENVKGTVYLEHVRATFLREVRFASVFSRHLYDITHTFRGPLDAVLEFFKTHGKPGDSCYIDNEGDSFAFHTGMKLIRRDELTSRSKPDWIVLRGNEIGVAKGEGKFSGHLQILQTILESNLYKKFLLKSTPGRHNNSYDIQLHQFASPPDNQTLYIYQLIPPTAS